jgi:ferredoxin
VASPNRRAFERVLSDIYRLRRPDLNIMDAVLAVEGRAQGGPSLRYLGKLLASDSAPALDIVASSMIGLDPQNLHHIVDAALVDGIRPDHRAQEIVGEYEPVGDFRLPKGFEPGGARPDDKPGASLLASASRKALVIKEGLCDGCGDCARQCPLGALGIQGGTPVIDPMKCVSCFACVEACSSRALDLDPIYPIPADS